MNITVNGTSHLIPPEWQNEPLLTVLRDYLALTGTKFGCGGGFCGACTVHINGQATRSCILPVNVVGDAEITTIEGLAGDSGLHPVQQAWIEESVPQCGYCQPGQIMTAAAFLKQQSNPDNTEIRDAMNGNLCRCGTYPRIRRAVARAADIARSAEKES